jgi:predicted PolB exonuclease-like 3'-5' exonuclease
MYDLIYFDVETYSPGITGPTINDKVITIAYAVNQYKPVVLKEWEASEKEIIQQFLKKLKSFDRPVLVGHNIFRFDIPVLVSRAHHHGMGSVWELYSQFVKSFCVDTIQCLLPSNKLRFKGLGLKDCAQRLCIINDSCSSGSICDEYSKGNWEEITRHNIMDVEITRHVYRKILGADFTPF